MADKKLLGIAILVIAVIATIGALAVFYAPAPTEEKPVQISVMMGFVPLVIWSPFYTALDKGFYADEGLNVTIQYTTEGSMGAIKQVAAGKVEFGYGGGDAIIIARSKGIPVVMIYQTEQKQPFRIIAKKKTGIKEPKDLIGKKVATPGFGSSAYIVDRIILYKAGVDYKKVEFVATGGGARLNAFLNDNVDASDFHITHEVILRRRNESINIIYASNYTNVPAIGLFTSEDMINKHPDIVRKFVRATRRGLIYAINHPEEAVDIFIKFQPEAAKDRDLQLAIWKAYSKEILLTDTEIPRGGCNYTQWEEAQDVLYEIGMIDKKTDITKACTDEFLPLS